MTDRFTRLLGIQQPIIQAPMLGVSTPALAAAVSNAGGLGSIAITGSAAEKGRALIREVRGLTDQPFNVNLFCHRPDQADPARERAWLDYLKPLFAEFGAEPPTRLKNIYLSFLEDPTLLPMLLEERPAAVSFHFGAPPRDQVRALQAAGIRVLVSATTPEEAALVEAAGADAVVAQGIEAGGHRGVFEPERGDAAIGTLALVRLLAARGSLPVVAAGGIMDGRGIRAALELGASAVQMGTAFVLCPESSANAAYREALKGPRAARTALTVTMSGRSARGLPNRMFFDAAAPGVPPLPDYPFVYDATKALQTAALARGNHDFAAQWAGQGAALARELPAAELLRTLVEELGG